MANNIRIFFAGDFCSTPSTGPIKVSDELMSTINSCQLKLCNFEVPLRPDFDLPHQSRRRFYQHDDVPDFLRSIGFNLFPLATNHAFDWDDYGYAKTKERLGDAAFGVGTYDEVHKAKIVEVNGIKIGFIAVCFAAYKGVFTNVENHSGLGCAYINDLKLPHSIMQAKEKVDYLIVMPHDGIEYVDIPTPETIARYRDFIDWGADAVIGTHPHCPQGWEKYSNGVIFYSLGNFFFNSMQDYSYRALNRPHWYEGLGVILQLDTASRAISFEIVNTRNIDNLAITIDNSIEREKHNALLCSYLSDKSEYDKCYSTQIEKIVENEYLPKLYSVTPPLKQAAGTLLKAIYAKLRKPSCRIPNGIKRMIEHDRMRESLLRYLNK
ncbi:MAG: CapA family protein [Muribaculaceae bacterium]|nr:CapA family protein [Muribaculaceae bacterium]